MLLPFIQPCSPISASSVPAGDGWLHEPKLDGYRLQVAKDGTEVRLYSRRGHDWGKRLAVLAEALRALPARSAILDAELCFPGPNGTPNFYGLHAAMGSDRQHQLAMFAFDLLHHNGHDLRSIPLTGRRRRLERLLRRAKVPCLHLVEAFDDGQKLLEAAERYGLEGVVSKQRSAPYKSGECRDWRKVKTNAWREANRERWRLFEKAR
jgi:bifunctional non-homologous end joining protein LigD